MKSNLFPWLLGAAFTLTAFLQHAVAQPEQMPEYPGGLQALSNYMIANIKYPDAARKEKAEGTVIVRFTVETDGSISNISTTGEGTPQRPDFVMEAVRVVKGMPHWTPGWKDGKAVKCEMALPVQFKLSRP